MSCPEVSECVFSVHEATRLLEVIASPQLEAKGAQGIMCLLLLGKGKRACTSLGAAHSYFLPGVWISWH